MNEKGIGGLVLTGNGEPAPNIQIEGRVDARDAGGTDICPVDECECVDCGEYGD